MLPSHLPPDLNHQPGTVSPGPSAPDSAASSASAARQLAAERADALIVFLNELLAFDANALSTLLAARVGCNDALAWHPSVQVAEHDDGVYSVGFLGILNGFYGVIKGGKFDGYGLITAVCEEGRIIRFQRTEDRSA